MSERRDVSVRGIDAKTWDWIVDAATVRGLRVAEMVEELVRLWRRVDRAVGSSEEVA